MGETTYERYLYTAQWIFRGLDEVMDVSDRILVMYEGELVGQLDPKQITVEELGLYMAGAKKEAVPEEV